MCFHGTQRKKIDQPVIQTLNWFKGSSKCGLICVSARKIKLIRTSLTFTGFLHLDFPVVEATLLKTLILVWSFFPQTALSGCSRMHDVIM